MWEGWEVWEEPKHKQDLRNDTIDCGDSRIGRRYALSRRLRSPRTLLGLPLQILDMDRQA
ncbi:MAG: hypothetical protein F6J93_14195 [Oscillatoria sp. SIO1A7]|nr:hypothetical protein [Oscillatoria sp. SIO1A7]